MKFGGLIWDLLPKVRPVLVLSDYPADEELALLLVVPHTTAIRGNRWELVLPKAFLQKGVFHLQQIQPISLARLDVKLGALTVDEFKKMKTVLVQLLDLQA